MLDETDVLKNAFSLIFAFDEIVALGYRESVSLAQIRTFTEMDSQDERIQIALRQVKGEFCIIRRSMIRRNRSSSCLIPVLLLHYHDFLPGDDMMQIYLIHRLKNEKQRRLPSGKQKN